MNALRFALGLLIGLGGIGCKNESPPSASSKDAPIEAKPRKSSMPDWAKAFSHEVRFDTGRQAVVVDVQIKPGFHAYTVGESTGKPLKVSISDDSAYASNGDIQYPKGKEKNLPIGKSVIVEGQAEIIAPVKPKADAKGKAKGKFRYQVCTDSACDRPRTVPFEVGPA